MLVLWNGEYEEHEINDFSEKHLKYMDEQHKKWIGHIVGDFTVLKVEYDWGKRMTLEEAIFTPTKRAVT